MDLDNSQSNEAEPEADPSKAKETALELLKQLITLASGVLALSAAFIEKFATGNPLLLTILGLSWLCLLGAIFAGLQAMSAMVKRLTHPHFSWSEEKLRGFARVSKYCFVVGIGLFAVFAYSAFVLTVTKQLGGERQQSASSGSGRTLHSAPVTKP